MPELHNDDNVTDVETNSKAPPDAPAPTPGPNKNMVVNDDFPDELWACVANDVKLRESDAVVLEMCNMLKDKGIRSPELLEQAPQALITHIFPLETHARHHVGILHVQSVLRRRTEADNNVHAQAMHRLANPQEKARKDKKRGRNGETDSEGEDASTRKKFDATKSMTVYKMGSIPTEHMPEFDVQRAFAKRATVGFKERGN